MKDGRTARLACYLHACLGHDPEWIQSKEIAEHTGVNSTQVRRDLSQVFGRIGLRSAGYRTTMLADTLKEHLQKDSEALADAEYAAQWLHFQLAEVLKLLERVA